MIELKVKSSELIDAYYASWGNGMKSFDARRLREVLADDVYYDGPLTGDRQGAAGLVTDLMRFAEQLRTSIRILKRVDSNDQAAIVYEVNLGEGSVTCAEFIEVAAGRIRTITRVFDAGRYQKLCGRK